VSTQTLRSAAHVIVMVMVLNFTNTFFVADCAWSRFCLNVMLLYRDGVVSVVSCPAWRMLALIMQFVVSQINEDYY